MTKDVLFASSGISRIMALPWAGAFRTRAAGQVSQLLAANVAGAALSAISAPLIARLYSPKDVGEFALFTAFAGMLTPVFTLRYETAVILPKSDEEAAGVFVFLERLAIGLLLALSLAVYLAPENIFRRAGYESLYPWRVAAVCGGFFTAMILGLNACLNRAQRYGAMSGAKLLQNGGYLLLVVTLGWCGLHHGQMLGSLAAGTLTVLWLKASLPKRPANTAWSESWQLAKKHADAPAFLFPTTMVDTFTKQLPIFLITSWFSTEMAGNFSVAWRMVFLPAGLFGAAVSQVFFQRFARAWPDRREARRILFKTWATLALPALVPCVIVMLSGPALFAWVLGEKWRAAGVLASVIAPMTFFVFMSSPTSSALVAVGGQKYTPIFGLTTLIYRPACLWAGWHFHSLSLGLVLLTMAEVVQILAYNGLVLAKTAGASRE